VEVSPNILQLDQPGKVACQGGFNLPPVFSQLRRYIGEPNCLVNLFFSFSSDLFLSPEYAVFIDLQSKFHAHFPDPDIVCLGAGEVAKSCTEGLGFDNP